jgi:preprotein translocase SecF subunit
MELFKNPSYDFMSKRYIMFGLSSLVIIVGIVSVIINGGLNYSVDFAGGSVLWLKFQQPVAVKAIRQKLAEINLGDSEIQMMGETATSGVSDEVIIRSAQTEEGKSSTEAIKNALRGAFPGNSFEILDEEFVGPKVGSELKGKAFKAIILSLLAIVAYVSWRFEFRFAIGAIVALAHDVLITIGIFSIFGKEMSLPVVAALLTIVGYSLNDTIVVYDRIREELKLLKRKTYQEIVNKSINMTLSRTIITSLTTLFVVLVLFIFGGHVIHDFAFALLVGVVVGTYSSIAIASPLVVEWQLRRPPKRKKRRR